MGIYSEITSGLDRFSQRISVCSFKNESGDDVFIEPFFSIDHYGRAMGNLTANWNSRGAVFIITYLVGLVGKSLEIITKFVLLTLANLGLVLGNLFTLRLNKVAFESMEYIVRLIPIVIADPILHGLPIKAIYIAVNRTGKFSTNDL